MDDAALKRRERVVHLGHSLRNPLAAIQGALARLEGAGWAAPELDTIKRSIEEMRQVLDEATDASPPPPRRRPRATNVRGRVLVVDDNVEAARGLEVLLTKQGFEVATAFDGATGVDAALACTPDAVLLDLALGQTSGYDIARRLRAEPRLAGTRLIALTGFDQSTDRERTRAHGFEDHLVKPVVLEDLLAVLGAA